MSVDILHRYLSVGFAFTFVLLSGCANRGSLQSQPVVTTAGQGLGPLTELVPAAGLRWLVVVEPKRLWAQPLVVRALEPLLPKERLDAFEKASGLDLRALESGVVAGFDIGTLYLAKTADHVGTAEEAFIDRLVSPPVVKQLGSGVTHTTGIIGRTPESFLALEQYGIALSVGDPTLTKIAGAFALHKLHKSPSALSGAALRDLPKSVERAPVRFYAPGPFTGKWATGAQGLLASTTAVVIVFEPDSDGVLHVAVTAVGDYGSDITAVNRRVRQSFASFAQSDLGHVIGFSEPNVTPEVLAENTRITLTVSLSLTRFMDGLYATVAGDVRKILETVPKAR